MITNRFSRQWYLCYYIPGNKADKHTQYLLDFKNGNGARVVCWLKWAIDEIKNENVSFDYVVRVLSSTEVVAVKDTPLDYLGQYIEEELNYKYLPKIIYKTRTTKKLSSIPTKVDRETELEGVYKLSDDCPNLAGKRVLLLDDIATSGTSSNAIIKEIKARYPTAIIYLFTLGKTLRDDNANDNISLDYFK